MSKKKITVGHTTLIGGQGATFGEKGLEKEAHEKKSEIMKSQKIGIIFYFYFYQSLDKKLYEVQ